MKDFCSSWKIYVDSLALRAAELCRPACCKATQIKTFYILFFWWLFKRVPQTCSSFYKFIRFHEFMNSFQARETPKQLSQRGTSSMLQILFFLHEVNFLQVEVVKMVCVCRIQFAFLCRFFLQFLFGLLVHLFGLGAKPVLDCYCLFMVKLLLCWLVIACLDQSVTNAAFVSKARCSKDTPDRTGLLGLADLVWVVSVTGHFSVAVSVWWHFSHEIYVRKQLITFIYLNNYRQVKCHSSWCYANTVWGVMIVSRFDL